MNQYNILHQSNIESKSIANSEVEEEKPVEKEKLNVGYACVRVFFAQVGAEKSQQHVAWMS